MLRVDADDEHGAVPSQPQQAAEVVRSEMSVGERAGADEAGIRAVRDVDRLREVRFDEPVVDGAAVGALTPSRPVDHRGGDVDAVDVDIAVRGAGERQADEPGTAADVEDRPVELAGDVDEHRGNPFRVAVVERLDEAAVVGVGPSGVEAAAVLG